MTYREKFEEMVKDTSVLSFCLCSFIQTLCVILVLDSQVRMTDAYPAIGFGRRTSEPKDYSAVTVSDVVAVLSGDEWTRNMTQTLHFQRFLSWLMEKDMGEDTACWYSLEKVSPLWNEFVDICNGAERAEE